MALYKMSVQVEWLLGNSNFWYTGSHCGGLNHVTIVGFVCYQATHDEGFKADAFEISRILP